MSLVGRKILSGPLEEGAVQVNTSLGVRREGAAWRCTWPARVEGLPARWQHPPARLHRYSQLYVIHTYLLHCHHQYFHQHNLLRVYLNYTVNLNVFSIYKADIY